MIFFVDNLQHFDSSPAISIKEEPEIQKVPSLSDLSDPENSSGKFFIFIQFFLFQNIA